MSSILSRAEVSEATVGRRDLKDPRSKEYAIQTLFALKMFSDSLKLDAQRVQRELDEIDQYRHWEVLGYPSKQAMLEAELPEENKKNIASLAEQAELARKQADTVKRGPKVAAVAREQTETTKRPKGNSLSNNEIRQGTSGSYLLRRLARLDKDKGSDWLGGYERGEYPSARAAGIAAGIVKVPTTLEKLKALWVKATAEDRQALKDWIRGQ